MIEPALQAAETVRSATRPTNDLTAYDAYLRASAIVISSAKQIPEALRLLQQAIARDPNYGPALAWAATCCVRQLLDDRSDDPAADRRKGVDFARRSNLFGVGRLVFVFRIQSASFICVVNEHVIFEQPTADFS